MSKFRTANLLGAMVGEVSERLAHRIKRHPNQTDSAAAALNLLREAGDGASNAELASALGLSHPATVRLADKLESEGLLESHPGRDRRTVSLRLTETGRARARAIVVDRCEALAEMTGALSQAEQAQLAGLLEKMLAAMTGDMRHAAHVCRLCNGEACPEDICPVHQAALASQAS